MICVVTVACKKAIETPCSGRQKRFESCNSLNISIYVQNDSVFTVAILAQGTTHGPMRSRRPFACKRRFDTRWSLSPPYIHTYMPYIHYTGHTYIPYTYRPYTYIHVYRHKDAYRERGIGRGCQNKSDNILQMQQYEPKSLHV